MRTFYSAQVALPRKDFQQHHIIPVAVFMAPAFRHKLAKLENLVLLRVIFQATVFCFRVPTMLLAALECPFTAVRTGTIMIWSPNAFT